MSALSDKSQQAPSGGCYVILVSAGRGRRFGGDVPKQYRQLAGKPVIRHAIERFLAVKGVSAILPVVHPDDAPLYTAALAGLDRVMTPVPGGATRQESVRAGLTAIADDKPATVLIHDAARPFPSPLAIAALMTRLEEEPGAILASALVDTLKRAAAGHIVETIPRDNLWRAQTPQGFQFDAIMAAHLSAPHDNFTDDAALAEHAGLPISIVPSGDENFKITTEADLTMAENVIALENGPAHKSDDKGKASLPLIRVGSGFDVHRFGAGDHVWLGGVKVPHTQGLVGHSDADVGLHALTDAVLGAIADGDIGTHFSDRDPRWKGASSDQFLAHAISLLVARGGQLLSLDLTLICETPKLRPHHQAIRARIAEIADLPIGRVSVKATTTEQLGFTGRGEGVAAQALATVSLPDAV